MLFAVSAVATVSLTERKKKKLLPRKKNCNWNLFCFRNCVAFRRAQNIDFCVCKIVLNWTKTNRSTDTERGTGKKWTHKIKSKMLNAMNAKRKSRSKWKSKMLNAYAHRCQIRMHTLPTMKVSVRTKRQLDFFFARRRFFLAKHTNQKKNEKKNETFFAFVSFCSALWEISRSMCVSPSHSDQNTLISCTQLYQFGLFLFIFLFEHNWFAEL